MKDYTIHAILIILIALVFNLWIAILANQAKIVCPSELIVVYKKISLIEVNKEVDVSAYNAGDPNQCSGNTCISASGDNICDLLDKGINVVAYNQLPLGTKIYLEGIGEAIVLDRTASRFSHKIDIAMKSNEVEKALKFGTKKLTYIEL